MQSRHSDPEQLPVQLNIKVPWLFREFLYQVAEEKGVSLTDVTREAIDRQYAKPYVDWQTRRAGDTS